MLKKLKNNDGLTLVEVIASIVIITIILLSFSQVFIQTNKTAAINNEKLIVINLADAYLERLIAEGIENKGFTNVKDYFSDYPRTIKLSTDPNSSEYTVYITASNNNAVSNSVTTELDQMKVNVVVKVVSKKNIGKREISSQTEGYVQIEKK